MKKCEIDSAKECVLTPEGIIDSSSNENGCSSLETAQIIAGDSESKGKVVCVPVSENCFKYLKEYSDSLKDTEKDLKEFWGKHHDKAFIDKYQQLKEIDDLEISTDEKKFKRRIKESLILILTANSVEGAVITNRLKELNKKGKSKIEKYSKDNQSYQFSKINGIPIVHIWPQDTSSYTTFGSFNALSEALKHFTPQYVFSVGIAFGAYPNEQDLGDVLVADSIICYDSFNKVTDGEISLKTNSIKEVGKEKILCGCQGLENKQWPRSNNLGDFAWYKGPILTGGSVISDSVEKMKLIRAADKVCDRNIIGGEMEGSGIHNACSNTKPPIPFTIIKGICDWAVNKNGWSFIVDSKKWKEQIEQFSLTFKGGFKEAQKLINKEIKDIVQAYACNNAFDTLLYILRRIPISPNVSPDTMEYRTSPEAVKKPNIRIAVDSRPGIKTILDAVKAIDNGQITKANQFCTEAIKHKTPSSEIYNIRGYISGQKGKYADMMADLSKATEIDPSNINPYINRAWYYAKSESFNKGIDELTKGIKFDKSNATAYNNRGYYFSVLNDYKNATIDLKKAIELDPNDALPYKNLSEVYYSKGSVVTALNYAKKATKLNPKFKFLQDELETIVKQKQEKALNKNLVEIKVEK